jgi:hypothetical protein
VLVPGSLFNQEHEFRPPTANSRTWFGLQITGGAMCLAPPNQVQVAVANLIRGFRAAAQTRRVPPNLVRAGG